MHGNSAYSRLIKGCQAVCLVLACLVFTVIGRNFAAGMTGGMAFVYDPEEEFADRFNLDGDKHVGRLSEVNYKIVRELVEQHVDLTESERAAFILHNWAEARQHFWEVLPLFCHARTSPLSGSELESSDQTFYPDGSAAPASDQVQQ